MKEKSSTKKTKLEIHSLENRLFKKLTNKELKKISGGTNTADYDDDGFLDIFVGSGVG